MNRMDPLMLHLYTGIICSLVVAAVCLVLWNRTKHVRPILSSAPLIVGAFSLFAGVTLASKAIEAPREITAEEYSMLLTTMSARPEVGRPFKAAMRDGRITNLELHRISGAFPPIGRNEMRGVAQIVARDVE
jgi:hypothetical protein